MSYRATTISCTGFSPFHLLLGGEMTLPNSENLKAQLAQDNPSHEQRLENLKFAYK